MDIDIEKIRQLAGIVKEGDLTSLKLISGSTQILIEKRPQDLAAIPISGPAPVIMQTPAEKPAAKAPEKEENKNDTIASPLVGTFFSAPSANAEPFVKVGDSVTEETVVCIVEAMKVMNEIRAGKAGKITEIIAANAQPVEYGQALFRIQPA